MKKDFQIGLCREALEYLIKMKLSPRQIEVVKWSLSKTSQKEIADAMFIHVKSVKFHMTSVFQKLNVKSQHALLLKIIPIALGVVKPPYVKEGKYKSTEEVYVDPRDPELVSGSF